MNSNTDYPFLRITADSLGSAAFKEDYGVRYTYFANHAL